MADSPLGAIRQRSHPIRKGKATNRRTGPTASFGQEFPSLIRSDRRLCFQRPQPDCTNTRSGSVVLRGVPPRDAPDSDGFICHIDGQGWGGNWSRRSSESASKSLRGLFTLRNWLKRRRQSKRPGLWRLEAYYRPPEAHFSDRAAYRRYLQTAAKEGRVRDSGRCGFRPFAKLGCCPSQQRNDLDKGVRSSRHSGLPFNCQLSTVNYAHE